MLRVIVITQPMHMVYMMVYTHIQPHNFLVSCKRAITQENTSLLASSNGVLRVAQWGKIDTGQDKSASYPITFSNTVYSCLVTGCYNGNVEIYDTYIKSATTSTISTFVGGANHGSKFIKYYFVIGK